MRAHELHQIAPSASTCVMRATRGACLASNRSLNTYLLDHPVLDVRPPVRSGRHANKDVLTRCKGCGEEYFHRRADCGDAPSWTSKAFQRRYRLIFLVAASRTLRIQGHGDIRCSLSRCKLHQHEVVSLCALVLDSNRVLTRLQC